MRLRQSGAAQSAIAETLGREGLTDVVVVGAHGGAGTSTLAALLRPAWDMGAISSALKPGACPLRAKGRPVVLVCGNAVPAARHATDAVTALHDGGEHLAALAIVSDGGPEPADATARFALLEGRVGGMVRVPYVRAFRLVDDPRDVSLPTKTQRALKEIRGLAERQSDIFAGGH